MSKVTVANELTENEFASADKRIGERAIANDI